MIASDYIALASAFVAVCALGTSIWQGLVTRKHARLSARPIMEAEVHAHQSPGIVMVNTGFGPARLTGLAALINDQRFDLFRDSGHRELTEALIPDPRDRISVHHYVPRFGSTVAAGQRMPLMSIPAAEGNNRLSSHLAIAFRSLTLHVSYESIYAEPLSASHEFRDTA